MTVCSTDHLHGATQGKLLKRVLRHLVTLVTLVYCGQTVGWIRMPLGTKVGLGLGDIVLDRNSAPPRGKGHSSPLLFGPCLL